MAQYNPVNAFPTATALNEWLAPLRSAGKTVVTTNGCFDIIHAGHIAYLTEASKAGDLLIVGINSDASVKRLKGESRPVQDEKTRCSVMAALSMVDAAFIFPEDDPREFCEILKPNVHVKGGDYSKDMIETPVIQKHGGVVKIVSFVNGFSTSSIVQKIRKEAE
jgi:rfaE bifunctional protein nucleotidyltransferase chain/domain